MTAPARTVLVTGCSSGIGAATAHLLAERGWRVFATARTAADLGALGRDGLFPVPLDLANPASVASAAAAVLGASGGRLDALVNNAGYCQAGAIEDLGRDALRAQFETNLFGVHELTRALLPGLAAARGRIVNVSSVFGRIAVPMTAAYCASKFALEALSDAMRIELAPRGIRVSIVEPGAIVSRFRKNAVEALDRNVDASASAYGPLYAKEIERRRRQVKKPDFWTRPPEEAARAIARALESARPRRRYFVTPSARLVDLTVRFVPQSLTDRILRKRMPKPPAPSPSPSSPPSSLSPSSQGPAP